MTTEGAFPENKVVAISSTAEADRHPLGRRLFAINDVADVFITPEFVTVSKEPEADWEDLRKAVETALTEYLEESDPS